MMLHMWKLFIQMAAQPELASPLELQISFRTEEVVSQVISRLVNLFHYKLINWTRRLPHELLSSWSSSTLLHRINKFKQILRTSLRKHRRHRPRMFRPAICHNGWRAIKRKTQRARHFSSHNKSLAAVRSRWAINIQFTLRLQTQLKQHNPPPIHMIKIYRCCCLC